MPTVTVRFACSRRGFTLPELAIGISLVGLLAMMAVGIVLAGKRLLPGRAIELAGEQLPVAPSPAVFSDAVGLHSMLLRRLEGARAIYVLGGKHHGLPEGAAAMNCAPLATEVLPRIHGFTAGLPLDGYSFYRAYQEELGPVAAATPGAFSLLIVGPVENEELALTALVQVQQETVSFGGANHTQAYVRHEVRLFDIEGDVRRYAFLTPKPSADEVEVGALHFWYRFREGLVAEEAPVLAVFPDPYLLAGPGGGEAGSAVDANGVPAFSRFVYLLAVSP